MWDVTSGVTDVHFSFECLGMVGLEGECEEVVIENLLHI